MKCYTRIKYMLIILSFITIGLLLYAKIDDASVFINNDFVKGFSEGFISSALVVSGLLAIRVIFFSRKDTDNTGNTFEDKPKLLWMVGAVSFVGYLALNSISGNNGEHNIPAIILLVQSLIYYGLYAGKFIMKRYSLR